MRKLNTILSVLLLFICLLHGLMGSFMLLGISSGAGKFLAWIGVGILAAHTVLGLLLTAQTFRASRSGGKLYGKQEMFPGSASVQTLDDKPRTLIH